MRLFYYEEYALDNEYGDVADFSDDFMIDDLDEDQEYEDYEEYEDDEITDYDFIDDTEFIEDEDENAYEDEDYDDDYEDGISDYPDWIIDYDELQDSIAEEQNRENIKALLQNELEQESDYYQVYDDVDDYDDYDYDEQIYDYIGDDDESKALDDILGKLEKFQKAHQTMYIISVGVILIVLIWLFYWKCRAKGKSAKTEIPGASQGRADKRRLYGVTIKK
ncbi:Oidioi.mRNA.OKI2018_I69.PAR.g9439.t1.cds [Oikopleura dioica]|uniref:Oidioi.mRNA.OKI2018_I69.PAR.g9439.t1.cds n=1 Tax=Oikopleura dioica TaxID=34765 RepID=A0ABN7RNC0_OIKDI|nr:Oidioi.mRNA.OKI2018_I69.PAR.g9439.t1.cds [Oikopleura dioica]